MREMKFRAKRLDNGEWVCGDLHLNTPYPHIHFGFGNRAKIDIDTIGQFTGLHDKNGKEIYEGDILRGNDYPYFCSDKGVYNYYAIVEWDEEIAQFYLYTHLVKGADVRGVSHGVGIEIDENLREMEVIGNIHDNPELLK